MVTEQLNTLLNIKLTAKFSKKKSGRNSCKYCLTCQSQWLLVRPLVCGFDS